MALAAGLAVAIAAAAPPVSAERRQSFELEPVVLYWAPNSARRAQVSVISYTYGNRFDRLIAYFGGSIGFFTLQTRGGITWLPGDLNGGGLMVRLDVRPQVRFGKCFEPMVLGSLGAGYRWALERGDPGSPGTAMYVLPAFTGGEGFLHEKCGTVDELPLKGTALYGGTVSAGFDW